MTSAPTIPYRIDAGIVVRGSVRSALRSLAFYGHAEFAEDKRLLGSTFNARLTPHGLDYMGRLVAALEAA